MKKIREYITEFSGSVSENAKSIMLIAVETAVLLNVAAIILFLIDGVCGAELYSPGATFGSAAQKILVIGTVAAVATDISKKQPVQH